MKTTVTSPRSTCGRLFPAALILALAGGALSHAAVAADESCAPHGADRYVCGIASAEDLVHVPGTPWLLASAFSQGALLNAINTEEKSWQRLAPGELYTEDHDRAQFPDCPGPVGTQRIVTHGLHLAREGEDELTLYAVGHGDREAIEVFSVTARGDAAPRLQWQGCVPTPGSQAANSVVSLANGDLLVTIPLETGFAFAQSMEGVATGAVHRWRAASRSWQRLAETAQPYPNGISVSEDETRFYVASSPHRQVVAYSNAESARVLGRSEELSIFPDNLHRDERGVLVTAGMLSRYTPCSPYNAAGEFDLEAFGACPRPYQVITVDPDTLAVKDRIAGEVSPAFSNVTMGVAVNDTLWIGSFGADRVAYRPLRPVTGEYFSLRPAVEQAYGYTHAIRVGDSVKVSGAVSMDASGNPTAVGDMAGQVENVYADLRQVLAHFGLGFEHVTVENVFTTDLERLQEASAGYRRAIYGSRFPTGTWVQIDRLALPEFLVEIELEAQVPRP